MKKIYQKLILFFATVLARPILLLYRETLSIKIINKRYLKKFRSRNQNFILSFWHENMILPLLVHDGQGIHALVSKHFDGEIITRILRSFRLAAVRGSSTRGGKEAYQVLKRGMLNGPFEAAFTPDGPTGPRRKAKLGVVRLSSETGAPIIPIGVAATRYYRMGSWDRLLLILPFSRCVLYYG
ncbi:MAG TPA: DUF374 domain-containing protein, partial [Bacteroidetes bacterium]|nr:DUF374 domain-containing protein [Bacteroidota bacterium]